MSKADSTFQLELELPIIKAVAEFIEVSELSSDPIKENNCTFKFDFHNKQFEIIGEIYTCVFPLKPGHIRKIKSDILKLITYEVLQNKNLNKYVVLTVNQSDLNKKDFISNESKIIPHDYDKFSLLGSKSWFNQSIQQFNIQILYFILSNQESDILTNVRTNQKAGILKTTKIKSHNEQ